MGGYKFHESIADPEHFVSRYIRYAEQRTDAPWDYHEAQALILLSLATQGILWKLPAVPGGLATNLYMLNHGATSTAKKSTAMKIAKEIQRKAMPNADIPDNFTPTALEEIMSRFNSRPVVIWADEFTLQIEKMYHQSFMAGLRPFLLSMYGERRWQYQRANKGKDKKTEDLVQIEDAHLCLVGNTTPAVTALLRASDIEDGFLPRFAVIWPQSFPPTKGLRDMYTDEDERENLTKWLSLIRDTVINITELQDRSPSTYECLVAEDGAYDVLDEYQGKLRDELEHKDPYVQSMCQRLVMMALKVSVLIAIGRPGVPTADHVTITGQDATEAVSIISKWKVWAELFVESMSNNYMSKELNRVVSHLEMNGGATTRTEVARKVRMTKRQMDDLQMTMIDQGLIKLQERRVGDSKKPTTFWVLNEEEREDVE